MKEIKIIVSEINTHTHTHTHTHTQRKRNLMVKDEALFSDSK